MLPLRRVNRGEAGRVLRNLRAQDFIFTVLETQQVSRSYIRLKLSGNGFLRHHRPYPTMWVRLWFADPDDHGAGHQRAYTLVDPDAETDTFWLEFALHDGVAARWALAATPGQQIEASLYGSEPSLPGCNDVDTHVLVGDLASLPAINSLLDAISPAPAVVLLEWVHESDRELPVRLRTGDRVRWIKRESDGRALLNAVTDELQALADAGARIGPEGRANLLATGCSRIFAWGACDTVTTRQLTNQLRAAGLRRDCIKTLGYWLPTKADSALAS